MAEIIEMDKNVDLEMLESFSFVDILYLANTARKHNRKLYKIQRFCERNLNDFTNEILKIIYENSLQKMK